LGIASPHKNKGVSEANHRSEKLMKEKLAN
jgi:hypothetical protein